MENKVGTPATILLLFFSCVWATEICAGSGKKDALLTDNRTYLVVQVWCSFLVGDECSKSLGTFVVRTYAIHCGSKKAGDLVLALSWACWVYFDNSGIHLNFVHSICVCVQGFMPFPGSVSHDFKNSPGSVKIILMKISFKIQFPLQGPYLKPCRFPLTLAGAEGNSTLKRQF